MTHIRVDVDGAVGTITIDRRERFNSLDVETARDLRKAGLQMARDSEIRAVVLRGEGGVFCSGADLKDIRAASPAYGQAFKEILEYIHSTISEIRRAPKPFIAAVDGIAAAGGFGLAMACDLVVASDRASFEWAYTKTGLTGAESSTFMLPRLVGLRCAFELLFLNPRLTPQRALEIGLITAVYPAETFDADVAQLAAQIASGPTEAMGIAKELINQAAGMDRLDVHLDRELQHLARIADGGDFAEGIDAFFGKRQPKFGAS
jgi:2-(1,2-epoxy-1,2-dihydrophenyl)acetyl-CoA isomerase